MHNKNLSKLLITLSLTVGLLFASPLIQAKTWKLDAKQSKFTFSVYNPMVLSTVTGQFDRFSGELILDETKASKNQVFIEVDISSINTRNTKRDDHLRNPDFFNVKKYPHMIFMANEIKVSDKEITANGKLTIKETTKKVKIKLKNIKTKKTKNGDIQKEGKITFSLNRKSYGVNGGSMTVADKVKIHIKAVFVSSKN